MVMNDGAPQWLILTGNWMKSDLGIGFIDKLVNRYPRMSSVVVSVDPDSRHPVPDEWAKAIDELVRRRILETPKVSMESRVGISVEVPADVVNMIVDDHRRRHYADAIRYLERITATPKLQSGPAGPHQREGRVPCRST